MGMTMICDHNGCEQQARWLIHAAYYENALATHPTVAVYPAPMAKTCGTHLTSELDRDGAAHASTKRWVVTPV